MVNVDLKRLGEHTFITGSTGSGKSNTVYSLVARLNKMLPNDYPYAGQYIDKQIPTLIIEPAKGEYKQVFGERFNVYGTNPAITELLRINPFKFENGIHVLEHYLSSDAVGFAVDSASKIVTTYGVMVAIAAFLSGAL